VVGKLTCDVESDAAAVLHDVRDPHLTLVDRLVVVRTRFIQVDRQKRLPDIRPVVALYVSAVAGPRQSRLESTCQLDFADQLSWLSGHQLAVSPALRHSCYTQSSSGHCQRLLYIQLYSPSHGSKENNVN